MPLLKPYLGPKAHISLSWLSHPLLALLLIILTLFFLLSQVSTLVIDARESLASACSGVEGAANVMVSIPHYIADDVNEMNVRAVQGAIQGTGEVLDLALEGIEGLSLFVIDMYRSLFLCLLNLAVHGSVDLLIAYVTFPLFLTGWN